MKIKVLATRVAPDYYTISSEVVTAHLVGVTEQYDLNAFPEGGVFQGADQINGVDAIRSVERINGELRVTLCQRVIAGQYPDKKAHWRESDWIDAADYDPGKCYVIPTGMAGVEDYEIVRGVDVAGVEGWTVRKKEVETNG